MVAHVHVSQHSPQKGKGQHKRFCTDTPQRVSNGTTHTAPPQILRHFLEAFRTQSRPQEQLVQAASLLVMPMLEAGYEAGEDIVDEEALQVMVTNMFDPPDELASARNTSYSGC